MKALRILILVATVTVLGACGSKKGSKPNMIKAKPGSKIVGSPGAGFTLATSEQCGEIIKGMSKAEICQAVHDRIAQGHPCLDEMKANFVAESCATDIQVSEEVVEKLENTELTEEGDAVIIHRDFDIKVNNRDEDEVIVTNTPVTEAISEDITEATETVVEDDSLSLDGIEHLKATEIEETAKVEAPKVEAKPEVEVVVEVQKEEKEKVEAPVETQEVANSGTVRFLPGLGQDEKPAETVETADVVVEEPKPETQEVVNAGTVRFLPGLGQEVEVQDVTPKVFAVEKEVSEEATVTSVTELPRDEVEIAIKLDSRLPLDKKMEVLCTAKLEEICRVSYRSKFDQKRCIRKISKRDMRRCIKKETKNYEKAN